MSNNQKHGMGGFVSYKFIKLTGFITYVLLIFTLILGITEANIEVHEILGISTIFSASLHLFLNIKRNLKARRNP